MANKTYTFIIGTMDDFESVEDLIDYVESERMGGGLNYACHEFEAPEECDEETATLIGRGIAFSDNWSMDDTVSFLVTGPLDGQAESDMFHAGEEATQEKSSQQLYDLWDSNDPKNW